MKLETLNEMARARYAVVSLHDNKPHFITDGDDEKELKSANEVAKTLEKNFGMKTEVRKIFAAKDRDFIQSAGKPRLSRRRWIGSSDQMMQNIFSSYILFYNKFSNTSINKYSKEDILGQ